MAVLGSGSTGRAPPVYPDGAPESGALEGSYFGKGDGAIFTAPIFDLLAVTTAAFNAGRCFVVHGAVPHNKEPSFASAMLCLGFWSM